jgi:Cu(I)/Ag(I) efflux system membrane fusion protein
MKKKLLPALALVVAALAVPSGLVVLSGCRAKGPLAAAKKFSCPMHPQIVRDHPGECPICGMKLVPVETVAPPATAAGKPASGGERKILFYRSPMNPRETSPVPKKDEMGMDYVPVYADEAEGTESSAEGFATVRIDPERQQLIGLKTAVVTRVPFATSIHTVGRVTGDERRVHHVHTRYDAYVERVYGDFTGMYVRKGEPLAAVYSPDLYATQQEYLLALKASRSLAGSALPSVSQGGRELLDAARQRLLLWDISPEEIRRIEEKGEPLKTLDLYAPMSGFIWARTAYHGMKVTAADTLFDIVDLSHVWVLADVYEYELPRISVGQAATMTLSYWPGRTWRGTVTYVYPAVDEKTRTVKVRIELDNPKGELKPEMYADVTIRGTTREVLGVPDDAVLDSGTRTLVFIVLGDGRFQPRDITVGDLGKGVYEVKSGLSAGETVARGANFLVDSESRLKAALAAMEPPKPPASPAPGTASR